MIFAEAFANATRRYQAGDPAGALASCEHLIAIDPARPELWQLSGLAAFALGRYQDAADRFRRAQTLAPGDAAHAVNLANALIRLDRDDEASRELAEALRLNPGSPDAEIGLGLIARRAGLLEAAVAHADRALASAPNSYQAWVNRGRALHELCRFTDAIRSYDHAIAIDPQAAPAHAQKALSLLLIGDFADGWREYEWRGEGRDLAARARFAQGAWIGEPLVGSALLVHAEQGFGDTIQFVRFLPLAEARGLRVVAEVQPELKRLFTGFSSSVDVIQRGEPLPAFNRQIRLMSLPQALGTRLDSIPPPARFPPVRGSYLGIDLPPDPRLTVGFSWAGNPTHGNDRNRSIRADLLAPLGALPGIRWVSVQKDAPFGEAAPGFTEMNLGPRLRDFTDLAAVMRGLDLLITIDSAPAHLMGSLGRPVWILLPDPPDWRWLLDRDDSPWYPTARLFRQSVRGDWREVIDRVAVALARFRDEKGRAESVRSD